MEAGMFMYEKKNCEPLPTWFVFTLNHAQSFSTVNVLDKRRLNTRHGIDFALVRRLRVHLALFESN